LQLQSAAWTVTKGVWPGSIIVQNRVPEKPFAWIPEGSLAGVFRYVFLRSGRPRGPGKAFKNAPGTAGLPLGAPWGPQGGPYEFKSRFEFVRTPLGAPWRSL
jgi:hypothetical protein